MMNCELRCHILDRKDQLEMSKSSRPYLQQKSEDLKKAIADAQAAYDHHLGRIARRELFIELVESTLKVDWIARPDLLEKQWFEERWANRNSPS